MGCAMAPGGKGETLWGVVRPSEGNVTRSKRNGLARLRYALRSPLIIRMIEWLLTGFPMNGSEFRHRSPLWQREVSPRGLGHHWFFSREAGSATPFGSFLSSFGSSDVFFLASSALMMACVG